MVSKPATNTRAHHMHTPQQQQHTAPAAAAATQTGGTHILTLIAVILATLACLANANKNNHRKRKQEEQQRSNSNTRREKTNHAAAQLFKFPHAERNGPVPGLHAQHDIQYDWWHGNAKATTAEITLERTYTSPTTVPRHHQQGRNRRLRVYATLPPHFGTPAVSATDNKNNNNNVTSAVPRAVLIFCHELTAHQGRYAHLAQRLKRDNVAMMGFDFQAFGQSAGSSRVTSSTNAASMQQDQQQRRQNGQIEDGDAMVADVLAFADHIRLQYPHWKSVPMFVGGASFGATVALLAVVRDCQRQRSAKEAEAATTTADDNTNFTIGNKRVAVSRRFEGLILLAPALDFSHRWWNGYVPTILTRALFRCLAAVVPYMPSVQSNDLRAASRNLAVALSMQEDHLCCPSQYYWNARTVHHMLSIMKEAYVRAPAELNIPFMIVHGARDLVCSPLQSIDLMTHTWHVPATLKTFFAYTRMWHGVLHEPEYDMVLENIVDWLELRIRHRILVETLD